MKRKILLLMSVLTVFLVAQAADDYWIDVDFTRDSTMWKDAMPEMSVVNTYNYQCTPESGVDYLGHQFDGAFGKFGVSNFSYTPYNVENLEEQFIYAIRLHNNSTSYWALPGTPDVGTVKINCICGNATGEAEINLQKYVSGEGAEAVWEDLDPAVKFTVPPHNFSTTSFVVEKTVNLSGSPKLRFKGPTLKNVHIFAVTISKNTNSGVQENLMDKFTMNLNGRSFGITTGGPEYNATIFNSSGSKTGILKRGEVFTFTSAGVYLVQVETAEGTFAKKIAVF